MSSRRKKKKARKSRGTDMLSDIENLDIMLGGHDIEREGRVNLATLAEGLIVRVTILQ